MAKPITTEELDDIARLGLDDLRSCFASNAPPGAQERGELALKIIRQGGTRMSAENNRLATALKVAKAAAIPPEDLKVLWQQVIGASGQSVTKLADPLAPTS